MRNFSISEDLAPIKQCEYILYCSEMCPVAEERKANDSARTYSSGGHRLNEINIFRSIPGYKDMMQIIVA